MKFNFFKTAEQPMIQPVTPLPPQNDNIVDFKASSIQTDANLSSPYLSEIKNSYGYIFGDRNLYPQQLCELYINSPLNAACLNYKKLLTVGEGLQFDTTNLTLDKQITGQQLNFFFQDMIDDLAMDYFVHNRFYIEITWNPSFTKIIKMKHINAEKIRVFDLDQMMEPVAYKYCWDWKMVGRFGTVNYPKFCAENKTDTVQLFEYSGPSVGKKIYSLPTYGSALNWAYLDAQMGQFHKANIQNGLNPSLVVKFPNNPDTKDKMDAVRQSLVDSFAGSANAGRVMTVFAKDRENLPDIEQLPANMLDKSFLQLTDVVQRQIAFAHNINPDLLGMKTPGSLGQNAGQIEEIKKQFVYSTIRPAVKCLENNINYLASFNGVMNSFSIKPTIL